MKTLKEYIIEGILDIEDNIENLTAESLIEDFIRENYNTTAKIQIKKKVDKYIVSTKGHVEVKNNNITELTNGLFEWSEVGGWFSCIDCTSLKSLKYAPKKVGESFSCNGCTSLKDLIGAPKEVGVSFSCIGCTSLESLEGAPEKVEWDFYCDKCISLKSLEGAPEKVGWNFYCDKCISLKSLEGAPKKVGRGFSCSKCGKKFTEEDVRAVCNVKDRIKV